MGRRTGRRPLAVRLARGGVLGLVATTAALMAPVAALTPLAPAWSATGTMTVSATELTIPVGAEPDGSAVSLDATVFAPGTEGRHPAVLLGHGFGGSKADLVARAEDLAGRGFVVLTWTARGFGASGGRIHLNDPALEGADVTVLVDRLADRPDVELDGPGDPRVGIVGASYGGAIALIGAALDERIDTVAAAATWNDLAQSLFPQSVTTEDSPGTPGTPAELDPIAEPGPLKQLWVSRFFATSVGGQRGGRPQAPPSPAATPADAPSAADAPSRATGGPLLCGRFDPTVCRLLMAAAEGEPPSPELLTLLRAHSPAAVLTDLTAPTFLVQGMADSLFGLDQADATARTLAAQRVPVAVRWIDGGHDAPSSTAAADDAAVDTWLEHYLRDGRPGATSTTQGLPVPAFAYAGPRARRAKSAPTFTAGSYTGLAGPSDADFRTMTLHLRPARPRTVLTPPGGQPASTTVVPGLGLLGSGAGSSSAGDTGGTAAGGGLGALPSGLPTYQLAALPGQSAAFDSYQVSEPLDVVGSPRFRVRVTSTGRSVTLFASLWQVQGVTTSQPRQLVAPLTLPVTPGVPTEATVVLPAATWTMPAGSRWRILLTSTDTAFANIKEARVDRVEVVGGLELPLLDGTPLVTRGERDTESIGVAIAIGVALLGLAVAALLGRRRRATLHPRTDLADVPLVVSNLVKTYADGHRAVDDVTWRAEKGQVVGLLGPNGAGKTTTIRMVLGLIRPDAGSVHVMGEPVTAGAPVLGRVGALVEGPGFLPHLTGRQNLHAYWRATGRPEEEAGYEEALAVAALGGALDRPVKTYSHGMKQRLGIAQAMLGLPELLILDEPTNGLDPPQIAAMRPILHAYAAAGRTVVISSHLLGEVEQTCSHVVVMHAGRVVTTGAVADLVASEDTTVLELGPHGDHAAEVAGRLRRADGIRAVDVEDAGEHGRLTVVAARPRGEVVRAAIDAGADVVGVGSRRHLEEVFLGVIAEAAHADRDEANGGSLIERLRQVRAR